MKNSSSLTLREQVPLYVRWSPDRSPHAVELRLDLVGQIGAELAQAQRVGIEVGGLLLGTLPNAESPTLRIDEVAMIGRRFEDGAVYMLEPGQQHRFAEIREAAKSQGRVAVGFFRSHLRPGPMQPSVADKALLAEQFGLSLYVFLLIQSREPRTAAFFLSSTSGQLPDQPSVRKFFFDDSEFKFLPEVAGEDIEAQHSDVVQFQSATDQRYRWLAVVSTAALALLLIIGAFAGGISRLFRPPSNKLDLAVNSDEGNVLKISWDHSAPFVTRARGAVITIVDGRSRREVHLGPDELKLGQVDYEHQAKRVGVSVVLDSPDSNLPPQTFDWVAQ